MTKYPRSQRGRATKPGGHWIKPCLHSKTLIDDATDLPIEPQVEFDDRGTRRMLQDLDLRPTKGFTRIGEQLGQGLAIQPANHVAASHSRRHRLEGSILGEESNLARPPKPEGRSPT